MTFTVQIAGGTAEEVYGGLPACDQYLLGMIGKGAAAYRKLPANGDDRKRLLIAATRYVDQLTWVGVALLDQAADPTTLQFPRSGVKLDGADATEASQLDRVSRAVFELVAVFAASAAAAAQADTSSNIRALGAGSARVEFFSPTSVEAGSASVLPPIPERLLGMWLTTTTSVPTVSVGGSSSTSSSECPTFPGGDEKRWQPL